MGLFDNIHQPDRKPGCIDGRHAGRRYLPELAPAPGEHIIKKHRYSGFFGTDLDITLTGYILPTGAVFDSEFRCTFDLLATIPSATNSTISVKDDFFAFHARYPFNDRGHIIDRNGRIVHRPHFGLSTRDRLNLVLLALAPEAILDGRRIDEFFRPEFFGTEFWLPWTTIMGPLPQHSVTEVRRYMNRFLPMLPDLSVMSRVLRTRFDQYETIIEPMLGGCARVASCY